MRKKTTVRKRHAGDVVRTVLVALGSAINTYAAQQQRPGLFFFGALIFVIGAAGVIIARIDCETMIRLALEQPATTTRDQLDALMRGSYWD